MVLDHVVCGNRRCVNPWHLEVVTATENSRRGRNAKINQQIADEIRRMKASGITQAEIARVFGVSWSLVSDVVRGNTWRPLTLEQDLTKTSIAKAPDIIEVSEVRLNAQVLPAATRPDQTLVFATIPAVLVDRREHNYSPLNTRVAKKKDSFTKLTCRQKLLPRVRGPSRS
jgi:predicted XRE-type DNA-binding protein